MRTKILFNGSHMPAHPFYLFYRWFWVGLDWLYPPICGGCGKEGARWCSECNNNTKVISSHICIRCGNFQPEGGLCKQCQISLPACQAIRSWAMFEGPVRNAIHRLKYYRDIGLGETLARPLIALFQRTGWIVDMIVPVPLGVDRLRERGYNQATMLARPLALGLGLPLKPYALDRIRETHSQVGLTLAQRKTNVAGAFKGNPSVITGKRILIVDDVATSGTTLNESGAALIDAGAEYVYGLTLARAGAQGDALSAVQ